MAFKATNSDGWQSAEAEIYSTNECIKFFLELVQILEFLEVKQLFMPPTNIIYNDNQACVNGSKRSTTKGLCHIQMRVNCVRENIVATFVSIHRVGGKLNLSDISAKEMNDTSHFVELRHLFMCHRFIVRFSLDFLDSSSDCFPF